ncbi:MAG: hypothetical protein V9E96_04755 [Chitinophagaceae bacterium]
MHRLLTAARFDTPNMQPPRQTKDIRFTQFYNNAKCTTTRASLLSGMYPRNNGNAIPRDIPTIAEAHPRRWLSNRA